MDAQQYVDRIAEARGSVPEFHLVMAKHDFPVLTATDDLTKTAVLSRRSLDPRTKELLFVVALVALRGDPADTAMHIRAAQRAGASATDVLEALEMLIPLGGVIPFKEGLRVWCEATGSTGLEASPAPVTTAP